MPIQLDCHIFDFYGLYSSLGRINSFRLGNTYVCLVYWVGIPSCFIFLQIYMVTNINDISWGTRSSGGGKPKVNLTFKDCGFAFKNNLSNRISNLLFDLFLIFTITHSQISELRQFNCRLGLIL